MLTVAVDDILRQTAFTYNKKVKAHKQKRKHITPGQIDIMIALAHVCGEYDDQKGVVFI